MQNHTNRSPLLARWVLLTAAFNTSLALVCGARADDAPAATGGPPGVSAPDAPGAVERLDKAREKEMQKQWKSAADLYQEALAKYPGRVVPVTLDPEQKIFHYSGIAPIVQERISKWPADGLAAYRAAYGQTAADLLTAVPSGNLAGLENVFWTYFDTDAGKTAGLRLIDAHLERGEFRAASWIGNRLLSLHPSLGADKPGILYRTSIACYRMGDSKQADELRDRLHRQSPAALGSIGGKDVVLVDSLSAILATPPLHPTTLPNDGDTYPSFGGLGGRGEVSTSTARPGTSLTSIALTEPDTSGMAAQQRNAFRQNQRRTNTNNLAMGIMPVVDAGSLFFQDGRSLYAVDADSGAALPGWLNTYGADRGGRYRLNVPGRVISEPTTITVTPSVVLAVMGQPDRSSQQMLNPNNAFMMPGQGFASPSTVKLVCLDRDTGKELWTRGASEFPDSMAAMRSGSYSGTPLFLPASLTSSGEDSVLVIARGGDENQFADCYAVCLSLKTGQFKWSSYLGSATRSTNEDGSVNNSPSQLALADGRVYVMTNLGTVAALDPADGRMIWFNGYERDGMLSPEQNFIRARQFNMNGQLSSFSADSAWAHNPVIVSDGNVFILPRDSKQLYIYDANTGVQKNCLPMNEFGDAKLLLGVRDGRVCLAGDKHVLLVNWKKYQEGDQKIATEFSKDPGPDTDPALNGQTSPVVGRGFVTETSIFIPTKFRLCQYAWQDLRLMQFYPNRGTFTGDQGPGNMLVTAHDVIVAGQNRIGVYSDLTLVRRLREAEIAAAPSDPAARLHYADALFAGGDLAGAVARVDEAIDLLGGINSMRSGKAREQVFTTMLDYASRGAERARAVGEGDENLEWENKFYDRAAAAAESPLQNAKYRLARAKFDHFHGDYSAEVELCQQILSDPAMRAAMNSETQTAGAEAEAKIDIAMGISRRVYAPIEQRAVQALVVARQTNQIDPLLAVASEFPNSRAAVDAREDAVHRYEADHEPGKAIDVLRQMYVGNIDAGRKAALLVEVSNDFLAMPDGLGPALDRLCWAARVSGSANLGATLRLPDGTTLAESTSYGEAIKKLRQLQSDQDNARLPDFHLAAQQVRLKTPFAPTLLKIQNVAAIVHPIREFNRPDQILTWGPAGLSIYPAMGTTPLASIPQVDKAPINAAWTKDHWLVWTPGDVYQISGDGKLVWDFPTAHLPTLAVSSGADAISDDPTSDNSDDNVAINGINGNVQVNVNGQVVRVNGVRVRGMVGLRAMAQQQLIPPPTPVVVTGDEQVTSVIPGGDRVVIATSVGRVMAVDFRTGQILWQTRPLDHAVNQLLVNPHFTVVRLDDPTGSQLAVYDTLTGQTLGRRKFGGDGSASQLVNLALSEEATLVIALANQVAVKDLYEIWKSPPQQLTAQSRDPAPLTGLNQPDQLLARGGFVACLYDGGAYARGYDLRKSGEASDPKATGVSPNSGAPVSIRIVGTRLYILNPTELRQYNLIDATDHCIDTLGAQNSIYKIHTAMLGKDYAILVNEPVDRGPLGQPFVYLGAYGRIPEPGNTKEWGEPNWGDIPRIDYRAGIMDWIGADGGVAYLTKDNNLFLMRGGRQ
jgi:outer membrane protein assembly factor BamB/tetratricopeptide (TPR) repeat protein